MLENQIAAALESYRDARAMDAGGDVAPWRPANVSADKAILGSARLIRARARDLVRNNPFAKNAVRMHRDAVSGSGLKLALKIDWRSLGLASIEQAAEWQDYVVRQWESYAEGFGFGADARRQRTFSQLFAVADMADYVDGEAFAVLEMKPGVTPYQTCLNFVDADRVSTPDGMMDGQYLRGGIETDVFGEPVAYHIRAQHPSDVGLLFADQRWIRVDRMTPWGRPIVLHTYDHTRPEMTRGVSEFASAIVPMKMLSDYNETELSSAITQAAYAAVIKTELDWSSAVSVLGGQIKAAGGAAAGAANPMMDMVTAHLTNAADYYRKRSITWKGAKIPHLLPNESLDVIRSTHPNSNFPDFEKAFLRQLAAGLGVEAHELSKNYADVNYSAARSALAAVWRSYRTRRNRLVSQFAMPYFGAWLEEAVAIGTVPLPPGVTDFIGSRQYLVRGTFIAWGKPLIDPEKERSASQLGMTIGAETLEEVAAEEGQDWRSNLDQLAYEKRYRESLGLVDPLDPLSALALHSAEQPESDGGGDDEKR